MNRLFIILTLTAVASTPSMSLGMDAQNNLPAQTIEAPSEDFRQLQKLEEECYQRLVAADAQYQLALQTPSTPEYYKELEQKRDDAHEDYTEARFALLFFPVPEPE